MTGRTFMLDPTDWTPLGALLEDLGAEAGDTVAVPAVVARPGNNTSPDWHQTGNLAEIPVGYDPAPTHALDPHSPIVVAVSGNPDQALRKCFHLSLGCPGLERSPGPRITGYIAPTIDELLTGTYGRPCRSCALGLVLNTALPAERRGRTTVSFSAQPPASRGAVNEISDTAKARLRAVAAATGLTVTDTGLGPVAHTRVRRGFVPWLAEQLRVIIPPPHVHVTDDVLDVAWGLAATADWAPELSTDIHEASARLFETAAAIVA